MVLGASMVRASALFIQSEWDYLRGFVGSYKKRANVWKFIEKALGMLMLATLPMVFFGSIFWAWSCPNAGITMLAGAPRGRMSALAVLISRDINGDFSSINNVCERLLLKK